MDKKQFFEALDIMNIQYQDNLYEFFEIYTDYMLQYNEIVNLTAITKKDEIYIKHYLDSISPLAYFDIKDESKIIDIGTGAGFPLLPIKIVKNNIDITLVDSLNKRIIFLDNLIKKLNLKDVKTIHSRAEELAHKKQHRQQYDICISRAVANMSTLLEYCSAFIKKGGYMLFLKGQNVDCEIINSKNAMKKLSCKIVEKKQISIPFSDLNHNLVIIEKIDDTANIYPRKAGTPSKNPL